MKRQNWLFRFGDGPNDFIKIPKAHDAIVVEMFCHLFMGEYMKALESFTDLLPSVIPQLPKPLIEVATNHSFFTGRSIESDGMKRLAKTARIGPTTSSLAINASKWMDDVFGVTLSPVMIDHLRYAYFSGVNNELGWIIEQGVETIDDNKVDSSWRDAPIMKAFFVNEFSPSVYVGKFYDMANEMEQLYTTSSQIKHGKMDQSVLTDRQLKKLAWYLPRRKWINSDRKTIRWQ